MVEYNLTHPNSEHKGSADCGGSRQYSSTQARLRTSDLSVCNPGPTAHLKKKMARPAKNGASYLHVAGREGMTHCTLTIKQHPKAYTYAP